jgi:hypothetical protein
MVAMTSVEDQLIDWLLEGDPSIRWRVHRDLLGISESTVRGERANVATEGWGAKLISLQDQDGRWVAATTRRSGYQRRTRCYIWSGLACHRGPRRARRV